MIIGKNPLQRAEPGVMIITIRAFYRIRQYIAYIVCYLIT